MSEVRIVVASGPRQAERLLLTEVEARLPRSPQELAARRGPLRIWVPSTGLARHLAGRLAARSAGAVVGLRIETLRGAALAVLDRAGAAPWLSEALFGVLAARAAARGDALSKALASGRGGFAAATSALADLLDAGLEQEHLASSREALRGDPFVCGLLEAAARLRGELARLRVGHGSEVLREASDRLRAPEADRLLACEQLWVHGFADATALATDFLLAAARLQATAFVVSVAGGPEAFESASARFGRRFRERLRGLASLEAPPAAEPPSRCTLRAANGVAGEIRGVAQAVAAALEAGAIPEEIGVVARDLGPYASELRRQFDRHGIPFSGDGPAPLRSPAARRRAAIADLIERGAEAPVELWLEACGRGEERRLVLALHGFGAARVRQVASLEPPAEAVRLPFRAGSHGEEEPSEPRRTLARLTLPAESLRDARDEARRLLERFERWPAEARFAEHLERLRGLIPEAVAEGVEAAGELAAWDGLAAALPADFVLRQSELADLLRSLWSGAAAEPLGGAGAGVQVLSVTEARGRTFAKLFLLGLQRGSFPRTVAEEPLLRDAERQRLAAVLPELPLKLAEGYDEERHLFAQLCGAAPEVAISWQARDDRGRAGSLSPLLAGLDVTPPPALDDRPLPPLEAAIATALATRRSGLAPALAAARAVVSNDTERLEAEERLARARLAAVEWLDRPPWSISAGLGPFLGRVGAIRAAADPRREPIWISTLEAAARCGWQAFLTRLLRLEEQPDPLAGLPGLDPLLLGKALHGTLERLARERLGATSPSFAEALTSPGVAPGWPPPARLRRVAEEVARQALSEAGIGGWPLSRALASAVIGVVERVLEAESMDKEKAEALLGVEVAGEAPIGSEAGSLHFRVDRLERLVGGRVRLVDFKLGAKPSPKAATRGERLQAGAYLAGLPESAAGVARYLCLAESLAATQRAFDIRSDDLEAAAAYRRATALLAEAWRAGALPPRLLDDALRNTNPACVSCSVIEACVQHDSSARGQLRALLEEGGRAAGDRLGVTALAVLRLGRGDSHSRPPEADEG